MTHQHPPNLDLMLIVGSVRTGRTADAILPWLRPRLDRLDWADLDVLDLAEVDLDPAMGQPSPVAARVHSADAFVVLTPEYNHGYPAVLKLAIDAHREEWEHKPVSFVAYGAGSGGVRAVEQLRVVLPELHATTTRNAVTIANPWDHLDDDGRFVAPDHVDAALDATMEDLRWWATTLRAGREADRAAERAARARVRPA